MNGREGFMRNKYLKISKAPSRFWDEASELKHLHY